MQRKVIQGFTVLELSVVVWILAIVAGTVVANFDGKVEQAGVAVARNEMAAIKNAIQHFYRDTMLEPAPANPADFAFLFAGAGFVAFDITTNKGWRGPYLEKNFELNMVDIGDDLDAATGLGNPTMGNAIKDLLGAADPFLHPPMVNNAACEESPANDQCVLDWRLLSTSEAVPKHGRPYLIFKNGKKIRLVSMGTDGRYQAQGDVDTCDPGASDDLILCFNL